MRFTTLLTAGAVAAITACGPRVQVRTAVSPDASLVGLHTFYVLNPPARRTGAPALPVNDPMLENSITNRALRDDIRRGFQSRGYAPTNRENADFLVAYYAGTKEKFDTTYWGPAVASDWRYTYWGRPRWAWPWNPADPWVVDVSEYTQGQVVLDVIDAKSRQLLWRGQGIARVSDDPEEYTKELRATVNEIVQKFVRNSPQVALGQTP